MFRTTPLMIAACLLIGALFTVAQEQLPVAVEGEPVQAAQTQGAQHDQNVKRQDEEGSEDQNAVESIQEEEVKKFADNEIENKAGHGYPPVLQAYGPPPQAYGPPQPIFNPQQQFPGHNFPVHQPGGHLVVSGLPQGQHGFFQAPTNLGTNQILPHPDSFPQGELNYGYPQQGEQYGLPPNVPVQQASIQGAGFPVQQELPGYVPPTQIGNDPWPQAVPDMPKIVTLDVKCEKNLMKVSIQFDKPFYGIIFSKGHYSNVHCVHLPAGLGRSSANFDVSISSCGTTGNTDNGLYGYGAQSGAGTFFENTIVIQYDPQVQEVWDQARKLRCTWHDQYEKSVTFRPFPVDMLDVVRADFAGDNVGCWMQIQVGKGPWASEVSGLVKIGQTMTMVLAIKDDDNKFDMLVRNCMAHDGKRAPIQLVDQRGCVTRPKLMSRFTKIKNFGASASVLSYAHFQAFKFPDSMEVHFQCTIQICRYQCPEQCVQGISLEPRPANSYGPPAEGPIGDYIPAGRPRDERRSKRDVSNEKDESTEIGLNKFIQVISTGDLAFSLDGSQPNVTTVVIPTKFQDEGLICMSTPGFTATLVVLLGILIVSCLLSAFLCVRYRSFNDKSGGCSYENPAFVHKKGHF